MYLWLQVLRLVNKDDGVRAERHERSDEPLQCGDELVPA